MFLQPHHFQQEARHVEQLVDARTRAADPHAWGFFELVLDEGALALGQVAMLRARGLMPDGTPFAIPQHEALPAALPVATDMKDELVCLAVPLARPGVTEVDYGDGGSADLCRWRVVDEELRDHTRASDDPEPVQTAAPNLRLMRWRDTGEGYARLGIARVVERRTDGQVVLDRDYIAPQVRLDATGQLSTTATLLHGLVQQRARALAGRMGQLSNGVSEVADFLMLQTLNRAEPVLRQYALGPFVPPRELHLACVQLAGELATFGSETRTGADYPLYAHDDLHASFAPVVTDLRRLLSTVLERHALQIELVDRNYGVRTAVIPDPELARTATFVLAVNARLPSEQLRQRFPTQSRLGPADRIRDLVNLQLPGVGLRLLPVAPRQLPFHAGFHYFELDRSGELWKQIERSGSLALHVAGDFPGLELEFWALRQ